MTEKNRNQELNEIRVSAIISTYNRYGSLLRAIDSIKKQTHKNIEVIVVNDNSEQKKYYGKRVDGVKWIDLEKNSKELFGYACPGYVKNVGMSEANGQYIAILDDDDVWLPEKVQTQLTAMIIGGWRFSCTEGYMGDSHFVKNRKYPIYHREYYEGFCRSFFERHYGDWKGQLPDIFDLALIQKHNFIVHSSVMLEKSLLDLVGFYKEIPNGEEDGDLWKRILDQTNCLNINDPLFYYDGRLLNGHPVSRALKRMKNLYSNF